MNEIETQLQESYDIFLHKYNRKMLNVSKKNVDALYEITRNKLKTEESDYKNKKNKYSIYANSDMCKTKYLAEIKTINLNNIRQMKKYIDEKYIQAALASEDINEPDHVLIRNQTNTHFLIGNGDDELAKIINPYK